MVLQELVWDLPLKWHFFLSIVSHGLFPLARLSLYNSNFLLPDPVYNHLISSSGSVDDCPIRGVQGGPEDHRHIGEERVPWSHGSERGDPEERKVPRG